MSPILFLATALAVSVLILLGFAGFRRIMRSAHPPALLDNSAAAFGSALVMTGLLMVSLMLVGFSMMKIFDSTFLAAIGTIVSHIAIWALARLIIPVQRDVPIDAAAILNVTAPTGGQPAH